MDVSSEKQEEQEVECRIPVGWILGDFNLYFLNALSGNPLDPQNWTGINEGMCGMTGCDETEIAYTVTLENSSFWYRIKYTFRPVSSYRLIFEC